MTVIPRHPDTQRLYVRAFGAVGDGVTDDLPAFRRLHDKIGAKGADLIIQEGEYLFASQYAAAGGISWQWVIAKDNVRVIFERGAKIISTGTGVRVIGAIGSAKPAGPLQWHNNQFFDATHYDLAGANTKGARRITLATAADAAHFAADDYVWIRTGQLLDASLTEPDSEVNQILYVDAAAGVLHLRWPLAKPYQQEYFISGTTGKTSTSVTANAAPYAVVKVSDRLLRGFEMHNPVIECGPMVSQVLSFWEGIDFKLIGGNVTYPEFLYGSREARFVEIAGNRFERQSRRRDEGTASSGTTSTLTDASKAWPINQWNTSYVLYIIGGTGAGQARQIASNTATTITTFSPFTIAPDSTSRYMVVIRAYALAPSTGCAEFDIHDNVIAADTESYFHNHEGMANSRWHHNEYQAWTAPTTPSISVNARSYSNQIDHNLFIQDTDVGDSNAVHIQDSCPDGGSFDHNRIVGGRATVNLRCDARGWSGIDTNIIEGGGRISMRAAQQGYGSESRVRVLSGWVTTAYKTVTLGPIPRHAIVLNVRMYVFEAFNSDGTDTITVGFDGGSESLYATATDVSTTGVKAPTLGASVGIPRDNSQITAKAYYTAGGSAPTTGQVFVAIEYVLGARRD